MSANKSKKVILERKEVRTKRLILRPLELSDFKAWQDAFVNRLPPKSKWDVGPADTKKCTLLKFKKVLKRNENDATKDKYYFYGVFEKKTKAFIGLIDFAILGRDSWQFANFGYQIYNRHWGMGYGAEAAKAGLKIGFQQLKLNRLEGAINLDNDFSIHTSKKIGMKFECIRKRYWYENSKWTDHLIYVATPEDIGLKGKKPEIF